MKIKQKKERFHWTRHSKGKMKYYSLSKKRVKRVMRKPDRKESGIAPLTVAVMEKTGTKKHPTELWVMYQKVLLRKQRTIKIISAWRYPGVSPKGKLPPIPEDTWWEIEKIIKNGKKEQR